MSDRNHRGSQNKLRGRRYARTHTLDTHGERLKREREKERETHTHTGGWRSGAKEKTLQRKKKRGIASPTSVFSRFQPRVSGGGKRRTGVLIDMDLFIYLSIDFALISDPR